jgi:chemotaxis protein CheX
MKSAKDWLPASKYHEYWTPLIELSAKEVFEIMLGSKLKSAGDVTHDSLDITSMVTFAGQLSGIMTLRSSQKSAARMAFRMLGTEPEKDSREAADAFGEISNMIAGNFKNKISGLGDSCMISVPTVIVGQNYSTRSLANSPTLEVRLQFEDAPVVISLEVS